MVAPRTSWWATNTMLPPFPLIRACSVPPGTERSPMNRVSWMSPNTPSPFASRFARKASGAPFVSPLERLVASEVKTTRCPSSLMSGSYDAPSGSVGPCTRNVLPSSVSRTYTLWRPAVPPPATRFVAVLENAT